MRLCKLCSIKSHKSYLTSSTGFLLFWLSKCLSRSIKSMNNICWNLTFLTRHRNIWPVCRAQSVWVAAPLLLWLPASECPYRQCQHTSHQAFGLGVETQQKGKLLQICCSNTSNLIYSQPVLENATHVFLIYRSNGTWFCPNMWSWSHSGGLQCWGALSSAVKHVYRLGGLKSSGEHGECLPDVSIMMLLSASGGSTSTRALLCLCKATEALGFSSSLSMVLRMRT